MSSSKSSQQLLINQLYLYLKNNGLDESAQSLLNETKSAHLTQRQQNELQSGDEFLYEWWNTLWSLQSAINPQLNQVLNSHNIPSPQQQLLLQQRMIQRQHQQLLQQQQQQQQQQEQQNQQSLTFQAAQHQLQTPSQMYLPQQSQQPLSAQQNTSVPPTPQTGKLTGPSIGASRQPSQQQDSNQNGPQPSNQRPKPQQNGASQQQQQQHPSRRKSVAKSKTQNDNAGEQPPMPAQQSSTKPPLSKNNSHIQPNTVPPNINQTQQQARLQQLKLQFQQQALMQQQVQQQAQQAQQQAQQAQLRGINVSNNQNMQQVSPNNVQQFPPQQTPIPGAEQNAKTSGPGINPNISQAQQPPPSHHQSPQGQIRNQDQAQIPNQPPNQARSFNQAVPTGNQNQGISQSNANQKNQPSVSKRNMQSLDAYQMTLLQMENQNNLQRQRFLQQPPQQPHQTQGFSQQHAPPTVDENAHFEALFSLDQPPNFPATGGALSNLQQQAQSLGPFGEHGVSAQSGQQHPTGNTKIPQDQFVAQLSTGDNIIDDSFFSSNILLDDFKPSDIDVDHVFNENNTGNNNDNNGDGMMDNETKLDDIGDTLRKDWLSSMGSGPGFD
ncbi:MSS11 [Candida margitis]|uniref:MSS11 n=1 Tax=Candida margitis TaxID=1775924 RepID=UPI0022274477|nr:MSS11 [Candida margitis]KAI5968290.1 MSS11 [Candida margitis]